MASPLFTAGQFIKYFWHAKGPHALHSPFVFKLYNECIQPARKSLIPEIEQKRKVFLKNDQPIDVIDFKTGKTKRSTISRVARTSLSTSKFSSFLRLLSQYLNVNTALETGTSLGVNALYLAASNTINEVASIEGSTIMHQLAKKITADKRSIRLLNADLYQIFEPTLVQYQPELIFLDADHRGSTIEFCLNKIHEHCSHVKCIVIHDIYWSRGMTNCWKKIVESNQYSLTVDIFQAGIIFPNYPTEKQHFTLRF